MSDSLFLDTNVPVYSFDPSEPAKSLRAKALIREALASGKGVVSYQVVQEFLNVALRKFVQPMTTLFAQALRLSRDFSVSWYDSLIVAAALEARCSILYSEDFQHGQRFSDLRVV